MKEKRGLLDYTGKTVLVTGGGKGAGVAIARQFARCGAKVAITYNHSSAGARAVVEELRAMGTECEAFPLDQSQVETIPGVLRGVKERFGSLDCLVNNAGIYPAKGVAEITEEDWDAMQDCNTKAVFFLCRAAAELMREGGGGAIVNISSINATNPAGRLVHYGVSKAAVEMLTKCLAHEFGPWGVRVNCVAPGLIWAEGQEKNIPGWRESYSERAPLGRLVDAAEIGNACVFFGSPLSSAVTGQTLTVDCGVLLAPCFNNQ